MYVNNYGVQSRNAVIKEVMVFFPLQSIIVGLPVLDSPQLAEGGSPVASSLEQASYL